MMEDGYKKSKLSIEDLNDPKYELRRQDMSEAIKKWHVENPQQALEQKKNANRALREKNPNHQSKAGSIGGKSTKENSLGIFGIPYEEMQEYRMRGIETQRELGIGLFRERTQEELDALCAAATKWRQENPEQVGKGIRKAWIEDYDRMYEATKKNLVKALKGAKEKWIGTDKHKETLKKNIDLFKSSTECPHCGKSGSYSNQKRWHFDNCKLKAPFEIMPNDIHLTKAELLELFNSNGLNMNIKNVSSFINKHPKVSIVGAPKKGANGKSAPKYKKLNH